MEGMLQSPSKLAIQALSRNASTNLEGTDVLPEPLKDAQLVSESLDARLYPIRPELGVVKTVTVLANASRELIWWLGMPGLWFANFVRLLLFTIAMLPAFLPVFFHYLFSPLVVKNVVYGPSIRHQLDVYMPETKHDDDTSPHTPRGGPAKRPVVVFVTGGAWIIGYKAWSLLMGRVFQANGIILVSPDYRNFPQGTAQTMVDDVTMALKWVLDHCEELGGDSGNITVMGQSAGAHVSSLALIDAAEKESWDGSAPWGHGAFARYVGISGPYDIVSLIPEMHRRGLHKRVLRALMVDPEKMSPLHRIATMSPAAAELLPPTSLYHGTMDATVPPDQTTRMALALRKVGATVKGLVLMEGKSHTDPILEDPAGGVDMLMIDLIRLVRGEAGGRKEVLLPRRLTPWMLRAARWFNPF